jgi:hypothetical protein
MGLSLPLLKDIAKLSNKTVLELFFLQQTLEQLGHGGH